MIVTYNRGPLGELITISLSDADLELMLEDGNGGVLNLAMLANDAPHLARTKLLITGPAGGEAILKNAVENRDRGIPVEYRDLRGT